MNEQRKRRGEHNYRAARHPGPIKARRATDSFASSPKNGLALDQRGPSQPLFCWAPPKAQRSWNRIPQSGPLLTAVTSPVPVVLLAPASHTLISA